MADTAVLIILHGHSGDLCCFLPLLQASCVTLRRSFSQLFALVIKAFVFISLLLRSYSLSLYGCRTWMLNMLCPKCYFNLNKELKINK